MYTEHFGLKALPFENVPDPLFFFGGGDYDRVLRRMTDALTAGRGLLAVAGPIGAGKTTLSQKLMADLSEVADIVWLAEPPESSSDLLSFLSQELGLRIEDNTRLFVLRDIREHLRKLHAAGRRCLVIIDESHLVSDDVLEGLRLLNNLEEGAAKLIQIILLGQQELLEKLSRPEMEAFRQRIAGLEVISKMDSSRLREYIFHRLEVAGGRTGLFSENALEAITLSTGGIPRVTNSLCDRSLRVAYEESRESVEAGDVHRAAMDLGLGRKTMHYLLKLRAGGDRQGGDLPQGETLPEEAAEEVAAMSRTLPVAGGEGASTEASQVISKEGQQGKEGLRGPLLLLASSLGALAASLWFYCSREGSGDPARCLQEILQGLF